MKTKSFSIIAIVAIITIGIIACGGDDSTTEEQPVATTYDLYLKDIKITVNYKKKVSENKPAHLSKIDDGISAYKNSIDGGGQTAKEVFNELKSRNGNYSINVIYDGASFDGFVATDGQTLKVHDSWLIADATTITSPRIRDAFKAMLAMGVDENGVP